ncbi:MAG: YciI family protein [Spirochaetaceae bacterium]
MKVMVFVKASEESEAGVMPSRELLTEMGKYNEALVNAGVLVDGDGLRSSSHGVRVRYEGKQRSTVDGPFAESKELVAGYWVWKVDSMEQAIEWAKKAPFEGGEVEIRPFFEPEDFDEAFTPALREAEERLRKRTEENA